jgi:NAD(P)H-dependent FMN reductase
MRAAESTELLTRLAEQREPEKTMADGNGKRCAVKVLVFGASLRSESLNVRLATSAAEVLRAKGGTADVATMLDFDCPSYDQDLETSQPLPLGAERLKDRLLAADAFLIAAPEYNASMSGALKNIIDWTSRFRPQPFNGRQGFLMSASPSMVGGNRGLWALRMPLEHLGARVYPDMFSLAQAHEAFSEDGSIKDAILRKRFESPLECFLDFVEASTHYPAMKKQWVEFLGEHPNPATERIEESTPVAA